jgi:hypothetical protein
MYDGVGGEGGGRLGFIQHGKRAPALVGWQRRGYARTDKRSSSPTGPALWWVAFFPFLTWTNRHRGPQRRDRRGSATEPRAQRISATGLGAIASSQPEIGSRGRSSFFPPVEVLLPLNHDRIGVLGARAPQKVQADSSSIGQSAMSGTPSATATVSVGSRPRATPPKIERRPITQSWDFATSTVAAVGDPRASRPAPQQGSAADRARQWWASNRSGQGATPSGTAYAYTRAYFEAAESDGRSRLANAVMEGHHARCQ